MDEARYSLILYRDEHFEMTLDELARAAGVHPDMIALLEDLGIIEPLATVGACSYYDAAAVPRLLAVERLRRDIGANLSSVAVILELVDRIRRLENENAALRAGR